MDVNNANTLSLMRHRIKPQNTSMGHVFQHLFGSGFIPIHIQCFLLSFFEPAQSKFRGNCCGRLMQEQWGLGKVNQNLLWADSQGNSSTHPV